MVELDLRLKRLTEAGLTDWLLSNDADAPEGLAESVADWKARGLLEDILDALEGLSVSGETDVTDRAGRLLGIVSGVVDITDEPDRQLGIVTGPLTDAELRASAPAVKDDYQTGECLAEQTGAGAALTFTFSSARNLILIEAVGSGSQVARVDPFGGTPTSTLGIRADDGVPLYLPVTTTVVKVFAPASMVVSVAGFSRA